MFKKFLTGLFINKAWDLSEVKISYNRTTKEFTLKIPVDDKNFELVKEKLLQKFNEELEIID